VFELRYWSQRYYWLVDPVTNVPVLVNSRRESLWTWQH